MLTRKERKDLAERLQEVGIEIEGFEGHGKHLKMLIRSGDVRCFNFVSRTISDHRAVLNIVTCAKRSIEEAKHRAR